MKSKAENQAMLNALLETAEAGQNRDIKVGDTLEVVADHRTGQPRDFAEQFALYNEDAPVGKAQDKPGLPEHSPFPWEVSHEYGEGFNIAHEIAPNCGKLCVIANVQYSDVKYQPTREQAKANAKLIVASVNHADKSAKALAAAEALAEALRISTTTLETVLSNDRKNIAAKCCIERNKTALAAYEEAKR